MSVKTTLAATLLLGLVLAACQSESSSPNPADPQPASATSKLPGEAVASSTFPAPLTPTASSDLQASSDVQASPDLQASSELQASSTRALLTPRVPPHPPPTPHLDNTDWVQQRLDAVIALYGVTEEGAALVRSLDLRQMRGEPGFFGSFGFKSWAGVGEASPHGVIHELSHSYWGGFPVEGFPELGWEIKAGKELSPGLERYHSDILFFMTQPPDGFEVFRQRLRNLPGLASHNTEPLFHNLEADMVYNTGGDLALVPPILKKYWSRFLREGPFVSWNEATAWYQGLSDSDRTTAGKYLGFEHLDLRSYRSIEPRSIEPRDYGTGPLPGRRAILAREETQRLYDFADQFDLLLGGPQREENFQFWRGYLRDKVGLHQQHKDYLVSLKLARASDLAASLDLMAGLAGLEPRDQVQKFRDQLPSQHLLVNFLPALDNRSLLLLFASGISLPNGPTLQATASFVDRLNRFSDVVDRVLRSGRDSPQASAAELTKFLEETGYGPEEDLRLFFDLLGDENPATAALVVQSLDKETVRRLIVPVPAQLRFILNPEDLLEKLDITSSAQMSDLQQGIQLLVNEPSGNFLIDEPFLHAMYRVVALRSKTQTAPMVTVLEETPMSLEGFIRQQPTAAADLLDSDHGAALRLVRASDPVLSPPPRIIYRLLQANPALAARLVHQFDERGEVDLVLESLAYLAYDKARSEGASGVSISLKRDGKFLAALLRTQGTDWMAQRLGQAFSLYESRAANGGVSADFVVQLRATLQAAVATLAAGPDRTALQRIIARP